MACKQESRVVLAGVVNFQILRHFRTGTREFLVFGGISPPFFVLHLIGLIVNLGALPRA